METPLWSGRLLCPEKDTLSTDNIQTLHFNGKSAHNTYTSDTLLETLDSSIRKSTHQPFRPSCSCGGYRAPRASLGGDGDPGRWSWGPPWNGHLGGCLLAPLCRQALQALCVEAVEVEPEG